MIRGLKILGNFSLATLNRGLFENNPRVRELLGMVELENDSLVDYEDVYYKYQGKNKEKIDNYSRL